jgi:hypothetical protein
LIISASKTIIQLNLADNGIIGSSNIQNEGNRGIGRAITSAQ